MSIHIIPKHELTFRYEPVQQVEAIFCLAKRTPFPIGFVWFSRNLLNHTEIGYIFVNERHRRQRIGTRLLNELRSYWPEQIICTAVGNELSTPWLKFNGFVETKSGWFLHPQQPEPCPMI